MPHEVARQWLAHAVGDLALARVEAPGVPLAYLAFHAQQCAEKAVKAVLLAADQSVPRTHDVGHLLALAAAAGVRPPSELQAAGQLTAYAVAARYPGFDEPVDIDELTEAIRLAGAVLDWARATVDGRGAGRS